jgi:hypothetical protein
MAFEFSSCHHSFIANFCHLEVPVAFPTEQRSLAWSSPGSRSSSFSALVSRTSGRRHPISIPANWEKISTQSNQTCKSNARHFHRTAQSLHPLAIPLFPSSTHSIHSASSSSNPSVASKSFLTLSNNAFATQGGTAFPICFLT